MNTLLKIIRKIKTKLYIDVGKENWKKYNNYWLLKTLTGNRYRLSHTEWLAVYFLRLFSIFWVTRDVFNLLNPTGHVMHRQFNIQQPYVLPTLYLCVLYLSENKQTTTCVTYSINWLVFITEMKSVYCAVRTGSLNKAVCCIYLRTNSVLCHLHYKLIAFYNRDEKCSLRGTNWVYK